LADLQIRRPFDGGEGGVYSGQDQREGMGLLDYQAMPSLPGIGHYGVLCTFSNGSAPQVAWTVHHVQNQTLLGHSAPSSSAGRHAGPPLWPSASLGRTSR
jgi:hypothetical protein